MASNNKTLGLVLAFGLVLVIGLFVAIFGFGFTVHAPTVEEMPAQEPGESTSTEIDLTGTSICLPHANPGEFETMECAFGIEANGENYAVDLANVSGTEFQTGMLTTIKGSFVPVEALSSDHWQNYDIKGIVTVTELTQTAQ